MKKIRLLMIFMLLCAGLYRPATAQVAIGLEKTPESFSVLELISNQKMGMRLPQMSEEDRDKMTSDQFGLLATTEAKGLMIYNTTNDCAEYWDGEKWISNCRSLLREDCIAPCDCDGDGHLDCDCFETPPANCESEDNDPCSHPVTPLTLDPYTNTVPVGTPVTITVSTTGSNPINNLSIDGGWNFVEGNSIIVMPKKVGENSFSIMVNNCATQLLDVTITATPCDAIESVTIDACTNYMFTYQTMTLTASSTGGAATFYQWYRDSEKIEGATNPTYVFSPEDVVMEKDKYDNSRKRVILSCEIGNACGSKASSYYVWVVLAQKGMLTPISVSMQSGTFSRPHRLRVAHVNLGAENETNPCSENMRGSYYQWGRIADGHEKSANTYTGPVSVLNANGQIPMNHAAYGRFITSSSDWRSPQDEWLWRTEVITQRGGYTSIHYIKTVNDPCPAGWRIPSRSQWASIFAENTSTAPYEPEPGDPSIATSNLWEWGKNGYIVGEVLFLNAAGYRTTSGTITKSGYPNGEEGGGFYWTNTPDGNDAYSFYFGGSGITGFTPNFVDPSVSNKRAEGLSVRCVKDSYSNLTTY